ncbi:TPA: hypothetical protein ACIJ20_002631 [Pseudomonas aeruginosa]|uniref:hypothetical protein n=1 Tax=Pseudomonas aeruginosa TaxID=287 RepID=UPI00053EF3C1|nr:hypothetical protein [Pseudomonas aeruginosa]EIX9398047.1 hypothetical protein [Pseudomonas aeruginosa]PAT45766.1 hypothetical protein CJU40_23270 [Pseudomonas aeruginosa]PCA34722.1 hypothetical protein CJU41_23625 [Pseudomonas aeruginosa]PCA40574.1 hypothetical protein CJU39_24330 [Pseudomonas aeruginosa]HCE9700628.1 hypothetical protein [Pseudomonas aeruginosa]
MEDIEKELRALVSAAGRIMVAAEKDRETAAQAVKELGKLEARLQQGLAAIPGVVARSVDQMATSTADKAAGLLTEKFREANAAAADATQRYQQASAELRRGGLAWLMAFQTAVLILQLGLLVMFILGWK